MIKTISYLGLGTMGSGMASNLLKAGHKLTVGIAGHDIIKPTEISASMKIGRSV